MRHEIRSRMTYCMTQSNNYRSHNVRFSVWPCNSEHWLTKTGNCELQDWSSKLVANDGESIKLSEYANVIALQLPELSKSPIYCFRSRSVNAPNSDCNSKSDIVAPVVVRLSHTIRRSTTNFMTHRTRYMTSSYDSYFANFRSADRSADPTKFS